MLSQASLHVFTLTLGPKPEILMDPPDSKGGKKHKYSVEWDNAVQLEGRFDLKPLNHHNSSPIYTAGPKL